MPESISAVVAGHICLDVIPDLSHQAEGQFTQLFKPGHLVNAGPAIFSTGGPVSNTGLALHRLGIPSRLVAKIGADPFGGIVRERVAQFDPSLADGLVVDPGVNTSYSVIISPPGMDRFFIHCPGANDAFGVDDIDLGLVEQAGLFHFGYPPVMRRMYQSGGAELAEVFRRAKLTGVTTSLDMSFPDPDSDSGRADWRVILRAVIPHVDVFVPSLEELLFMLRRETYEQFCRAGNVLSQVTPELLSDLACELMDSGAKIVVIKLGDHGLYLRSADELTLRGMGRAAPQNLSDWANQELWSACFRVNVVGTTGSGDATIAGFLSALLRGLSPLDAVTAAVAVGACNVEAADALGGIRSWDQTMARIQSGWERRSLRIHLPGWQFDEEHQLWIGPGR